MSVCNMSIEAGARAGLVAVDDTTIEYIKGRPFAPSGSDWDKAVAYWKTLHSDEGAEFDQVIEMDAADIAPQVTWGTSPEMVTSINDRVPDPSGADSEVRTEGMQRALEYMDLKAGTPITDIKLCLLYTSPSPRDRTRSRMPSSA